MTHGWPNLVTISPIVHSLCILKGAKHIYSVVIYKLTKSELTLCALLLKITRYICSSEHVLSSGQCCASESGGEALGRTYLRGSNRASMLQSLQTSTTTTHIFPAPGERTLVFPLCAIFRQEDLVPAPREPSNKLRQRGEPSCFWVNIQDTVSRLYNIEHIVMCTVIKEYFNALWLAQRLFQSLRQVATTWMDYETIEPWAKTCNRLPNPPT